MVQGGYGDDEVEGGFGEWVGHGVGLDECDVRWLPFWCGEGFGVEVDACDVIAERCELAGEETLTAADVQGSMARNRDRGQDDRMVVGVVIPIAVHRAADWTHSG